MSRALIIGTSNMLVRGGASKAIRDHFGEENVDNLSLGATSGTQLSIFRVFSMPQIEEYDYIFLDLMTNELTYNSVPLENLQNAANILYRMLPAGPKYVFIGFFPSNVRYYLHHIELMHRSLSHQFGIHFLSLRDILNDVGSKVGCAPAEFFKRNDTMHLAPEIAYGVISEFLSSEANSLNDKKIQASISTDNFFSIQAENIAEHVIIRKTSLRSGKYGVFNDGDKIALPEGIIMGIISNSAETKCHLNFMIDKPFSKYLCYSSERPHTAYAFFFLERTLGKNSTILVTAHRPAEIPALEWTAGCARAGAHCSGTAELETFFFMKEPARKILRRHGGDSRTLISRPEINTDKITSRVVDLCRSYVLDAEAA